MKSNLKRVLIAGLLVVTLSTGALARAEAADGYPGIWVGDGVAAEIRREDDGDWLQCRLVFSEDDDNSYVWTYSGCRYDAQEDCLWGMNVVRQRMHYDHLWDVLEEKDWSLNDLDFARFDLTESGLRFTADELDAPVDFLRLEEADAGERGEALSFLGRWEGEFATVRAEDRGVAYLFIVSMPMDGGIVWRWTYTCRYDAAGKRMVSVSASPRTVITPTEEGGTIEEDVDWSPGEVAFSLEDHDRLIWCDVTDGDGEDMTLVRAGD